MHCWGKLIGVFISLISGTGFWGVLLGLIIGNMIDKSRDTRSSNYFSTQSYSKSQRQAVFFNTTFQIMGHLTKSKGRVTEADIHVASKLMEHMHLHGSARISAQQAFREGKQTDFMLREKLRELRSICFDSTELIRMFLEIQLQAAFADGLLHPNERSILYVIAEELGFSHIQFNQFISMMEGGRQFNTGQQKEGYTRNSYQNIPTLEDALKVLGLKYSDNTTTIKRAYRKLMREHHPDKLVAKGLPPEMMEMAKKKAQDIQAAYDFIKKEKGFK
ncbi:co-chaperone DjlA [Candidatus Profftia sp. (ex Adelges kitamiensis)]|uniref:co-chaperone DjlA n=1 Tax=Candidatus Profftia sp. (ex Adelges kitamiensis) TaxID=2864218 RepID=UPI001CE335AD|nr:co-chaperone DjlA [Candidatus Profftia sp. (ex Adelges kitamiensis)]